jgi:hypothetical protein
MTDTHQIQFNNCLAEFIQKMQKLFPADKRLLSKYYKYYREFVDHGKRVKFIEEFIQYLSKYNKEISLRDEGLFSEESNYYPSKTIQLMKGIDFKRLWRQEGLSDGSKESIWKYLQTLYLIGTFVLKESNKYKDFLKNQQRVIDSLLENIKNEKQIQAEVAQLEKKEAKEASSGSGLGDLNFGDIFDENNVIIQIAKEIAGEFNLSPEMSGNPLQAIQNLFGSDGTKLQEIITKITVKMTKILQEKGLNEDQLLDQARQMNDKLMNKLKGIPGMGNIEKLGKQIAENLATEIKQASVPETADDKKAQLEKCQSVVHDLTDQLRQNFSQMDLGNLDEFEKMFTNPSK